ncbi:MAG: TetR/AcrR family transcriptional regulator [Solirubrobacteraceae bacterium]
MIDGASKAPEPRERIVRATARLLANGGREAVTTRAVEAGADVQAPTIYRLFGDKRGLLDAVAEHEFGDYISDKAATAGDDLGRDPVEVLREAWSVSVAFGLDHPALFSLMNGDPRPDVQWSAAKLGISILRAGVRRIASAGRLKVGEERAINLIVASARGAVLTLIGTPVAQRDLGMLDDVLEGLLSTITAEPRTQRSFETALAANALRAALRDSSADLTPGERAFLDELLMRLADHPDS